MNKILPYVIIIRPINCLLASITVWVGAMMTWLTPQIYSPLLASVATFLVCAAGNIVNDIVDIPIDRINRPERVLVQKKISTTSAYIYSIVLNITALIIALFVNLEVFVAAITAISLLFLYNYKAKQIPFLGNIIIAFLAGMVFITGGLAIDRILAFTLPGPFIGAVFAFLFHVVREIVKDSQDIDGDLQAGIKTIPIIFGKRFSIAAAMVIFLILTLFTYIPILKGWYSEAYRILTVYIVDLPLLGFLIFLWGNPTTKMLSIGSFLLKLGMGIGIVALIIS